MSYTLVALILQNDSQIFFHILGLHSSAAEPRGLERVCLFKARPRSLSRAASLAKNRTATCQFSNQMEKRGTFQAWRRTIEHGKFWWVQEKGSYGSWRLRRSVVEAAAMGSDSSVSKKQSWGPCPLLWRQQALAWVTQQEETSWGVLVVSITSSHEEWTAGQRDWCGC